MSSRFLIASVAAVAIAAAAPIPAWAQQQTYSFDIPAQDLGAAVRKYATVSRQQVSIDGKLISGKRSNALKGTFTAEAGLAKLLEGTGVGFSRADRGVLVLRGGPEGNAFAGVTGGPADSNNSIQKGEDPVPEGQEGISEIVVVGTTLSGVYPASSPVTIYTAEDIARTGATTTEQFVGKLPQNLGTFSQYAAGSAVNAGNPNGITSVDLRGLGVGTTLTLVNGRRIASSNSGQSVDVSLIPANAVDRVEVLTDGASAIYGSDAIGGVINFVLKDDYEGAETRLAYGGVTDGDMRQFDFSQTIGTNWSGGRALVSYSHHSATPLERSERSYSKDAGEGTLTPDDVRHNLFVTAQHRFSDAFRAEVDAGYAWRKIQNRFTVPFPGFDDFATFNDYKSQTKQGFFGLGLRYDIADDLTLSLDAGYSKTDVDGERASIFFNRNPVPPPNYSDFSTLGSTFDASAKIEGRLWALPGGDVRFSFGGGSLQEKFRGISAITNVQSAGKLGRRTMYGFAELFAPLVAPAMNVPFARRLELSLAARYTDYRDISKPRLEEKFGSSIDPKIGLLWTPVDGLNLRGTYGQSFRAPSLTQLDRTSGAHYIFALPVEGQPADVMGIVSYPAPNLKPETAETFTLGVDFNPPSLAGFRASGTYYSIDYTNRIGTAPTGDLNPFADPSLVPDVIYRAPSAAFLEEALRATPLFAGLNSTGIDLSDPSVAAPLLYALPNLWIYDLRLRNLAYSRQRGLDVSLSQNFSGRWGEINLAASVTHILAYRQRASPNSRTLSATNLPGGPPDWRGRASASWSKDRFDGTLSVNFVGAYNNPWVEGNPRVDSWTTLDLSLAYDLQLPGGSKDNDLRLSMSMQNLLGDDPPYLGAGSNQAILSSIGFDPSNANPLGRLIVLSATKKW